MDNEQLLAKLAGMIEEFPNGDIPQQILVSGYDKETLRMARQLLIVRENIIDDLNAVIAGMGKQIDDMKADIAAKQRASMQSELESVKREFAATLIDKGHFALRVAHQASVDEYTMYTIADNVLKELSYQIDPYDEIPY